MFLHSSSLQRGAIAFLLCLLSGQVFGQELDGANTSWIMTSTALVLFMTIPGLSLFYAGLDKARVASWPPFEWRVDSTTMLT